MTYDVLFEKHSESLARWSSRGLKQYMKARAQQQQQQQDTFPTSNRYELIEIEDTPLEEKHDHETQGKPGSSQDDIGVDMACTPQTLKRVRQESPSPDTASSSTRAATSSNAPTSARKLADQLKPARKQRRAAEKANIARQQQQQQEQEQEQNE